MEQKSVQRTRGMRRIEARRGMDIAALLHQLYVSEGRTQAEIATELGLNHTTVSLWMTKLGIETRLFASERIA